MWRSWLSDGSQPTVCLPACPPARLPAVLGLGTVPVPRVGFKFVNNFPFGLVDVMGLGKSSIACTHFPASSLLTLSRALLVCPFFFFFLSPGTCAALPSCPTWLFSSGTLSFFSTVLTPLGFISLLCPVLSSVLPTLCQLLLPQALTTF